MEYPFISRAYPAASARNPEIIFGLQDIISFQARQGIMPYLGGRIFQSFFSGFDSAMNAPYFKFAHSVL
jgi:hypothetical protein